MITSVTIFNLNHDTTDGHLQASVVLSLQASTPARGCNSYAGSPKAQPKAPTHFIWPWPAKRCVRPTSCHFIPT